MKQIRIDDLVHDALTTYAGEGRTLSRAIRDLLDEHLQKTINEAAIITSGAEES